MRYIVKYTNYKRYGAKSRITYEGQEVSKGDEPSTGNPAAQQHAATETVGKPGLRGSRCAFRRSLFAKTTRLRKFARVCFGWGRVKSKAPLISDEGKGHIRRSL